MTVSSISAAVVVVNGNNVSVNETSTIREAVGNSTANSNIYLNENEYSGTGNTGLVLSKNITIIGNGTGNRSTINGKNSNIMLNISSAYSVTFINIIFINGYSAVDSPVGDVVLFTIMDHSH